jgi:hypothetical protein
MMTIIFTLLILFVITAITALHYPDGRDILCVLAGGFVIGAGILGGVFLVSGVSASLAH